MSVVPTTNNVLAEVGSDLSYDLLVRIEHAPEGPTLELETLDVSLRPRAEKVLSQLREDLLTVLGERPWRLRLTLFQRLPDPFVWKARVEAAVELANADAARDAG